MSNRTEPNKTGRLPSNLSDCYVWVEILYLDSPTNYRECLPGRGSNGTSLADALRLLDDDNSHPAKKGAYLWPLAAAVILLILLLVLLVSYCTWL